MIGIVYRGDLNVNLELVKRGHAWAYRRYMRKADSALCINEAAARTARRGLWALPAEQRVTPWEWRRKKSLRSFTSYTQETAETCIAAIGKL
jgi:micrococcal nuclease